MSKLIDTKKMQNEVVNLVDVHNELSKIPGISKVSAKKFIDQGVRSVNDLIKYNISDETRYFLKYKPLRKIPYNTIRQIDELLQKDLKGVKFCIAGSYRRQKNESSDIDIVSTKKPLQTLKLIKSIKYLRPYLSGSNKLSTYFYFKRQYLKVDIFYTTIKQYPFAILYATGSAWFNVRMRSIAKRKKYKLNQYGLFDENNNSILNAKTEEDIFKKLGMKYKIPKDRK